MSARDTPGWLVLVDGRKWTQTGVACPNSKGMREWHCTETSLAVGWHKMYADLQGTWPEIHCFQCGEHIGTWITCKDEDRCDGAPTSVREARDALGGGKNND